MGYDDAWRAHRHPTADGQGDHVRAEITVGEHTQSVEHNNDKHDEGGNGCGKLPLECAVCKHVEIKQAVLITRLGLHGE